jgi:hypothetical protein
MTMLRRISGMKRISVVIGRHRRRMVSGAEGHRCEGGGLDGHRQQRGPNDQDSQEEFHESDSSTHLWQPLACESDLQ